LQDTNIDIKSLADFGPLPTAIEDGETFEENAYKKAIHAAKILGIPAIADDSGLVVEALGGAPGVHSARYAGDEATDEQNCQKLLSEMKNVSHRKAKFVCSLSIAVPSGPALTYEAECEGVLLEEKRGTSGFGYDPLFYFEELDQTFAELSMEQKNRVSHRGKALLELKEELPKVLKWLEQRMFEEKPPKPDCSVHKDKDWSDEMEKET